MFVKIVKGDHESLYECSNVRVAQLSGKESFLLLMDLEDGTHGQGVVVDKNVPEAVAVYFMNHDGKTIDTLFRKDKGKNNG